MTMFIKLENNIPVGYAVTEDNIRILFPEVNFPAIFLPQDIEPHGFGIYEFTQVPTDIPKFYKLVEGVPVKRQDGIYYQNWQFELMTQQEQAAATVLKAEQVRQDRKYRLQYSDWTQVADAPVDKAAWAAYRQALRDISSQAGFPWEVQWPTQP